MTRSWQSAIKLLLFALSAFFSMTPALRILENGAEYSVTESAKSHRNPNLASLKTRVPQLSDDKMCTVLCSLA